MVPTGSSLGLGDTIQDTGVLYGIDTERYTYCMVPTLTVAGHPPRGRPPTTPVARSPDRACRPRVQCWAPTPTHPCPQHVGGGPQQPAQWAGSRGRDSASPQTPLTMVEGTPPRDALPPRPQRATPARKGARCGAGAGSARPHRPHPGHTGRGTLATRSRGRAAGGGIAPDTRRPSQWRKAPPLGTPFRHPHSEQRRPARAHAVGPVLGPHARTDRTRDTRVAEPWLPAPEDGRPAEGQRLTPDAPHNGGRPPPPGTASRHPRGTQPPQAIRHGPAPRGAHSPKPGRGEPGPDRPPPSTPDGARDRGRTRGGAGTTWNGPTSAQCRDRARCARHTTKGGGGADAAGAQAHTHAKGTRGLPEGQPDRARGTHTPRGVAYQRARVRDTWTGPCPFVGHF